MKTIRKPDQAELLTPSDGVLHTRFIRKIEQDWPGVMRRILLELMPADELGKGLCESWGRPTKELYSMAGLIFLAESFGWTHEQAADNYACDMRVHYALNLGHFNQYLCERTYEERLKSFRESALAQQVFDAVTVRLVEELNLQIKKQRLDSTHIFSNMAHFGRTKLMSETVQRFLHGLMRLDSKYAQLLCPEVRERYAQSDAQLFGLGSNRKGAETLKQLRQQIAHDMRVLIEQFDGEPSVVQLPSYQALKRVFSEQCVVTDTVVDVVKKASSRCMQNPSDPDATYDGHKGEGYQAQIAETFGEENDVNLITAVIPETAADQDPDAVVPVVEQLEQRALKPETLVADTAYGSDENVMAAQEHDVTLVAPVKGRKEKRGDDADADDPLHALDFTRDEATQEITLCPEGQVPLVAGSDDERHCAIFDVKQCRLCSKYTCCPVGKSKTGDRVDYTDKDIRLEQRRRHEQTKEFKDLYRCRAGIEGTMSALKRGLKLGRLPVRGKRAVDTAIYLKAAAYNMKQAVKGFRKRAKEQKKQLEQAILAYKRGYSAIEPLLQWETYDRYKTKGDAVCYYGFGYNVERRLFAL